MTIAKGKKVFFYISGSMRLHHFKLGQCLMYIFLIATHTFNAFIKSLCVNNIIAVIQSFQRKFHIARFMYLHTSVCAVPNNLP
jgi:hypothetical protein